MTSLAQGKMYLKKQVCFAAFAWVGMLPAHGMKNNYELNLAGSWHVTYDNYKEGVTKCDRFFVYFGQKV